MGNVLFVLYIRNRISVPLNNMVSQMKDKKTVPPSGAAEIRYVTNTYNEIFEENQRSHAHLTYEVMHDKLTGLMNRGAYEVLTQDIDMEHAALILVDVDEFKTINDTYGHDMGDRVLKRVAEILKYSFRSVDQVFPPWRG